MPGTRQSRQGPAGLRSGRPQSNPTKRSAKGSGGRSGGGGDPKAKRRRRSPLPDDVITAPVPHVLTRTTKQLHGWWPSKRDCTSERLLINPYNGCSHDCAFCYAHALPGRFAMFAQHGVVSVCEGFDREVAKQLDSLTVASCGYLSPVTDPFQPVDGRYGLSVAIIGEFVRRGLPVDFVTKGVVPDEALELMAGHPHCFGQVSLLTLDDARHRRLAPGAASPAQLLDNLRRLRAAGLYAVARLDPVIPYLTDDPHELRQLVGEVREAGANHLVVSCLDVSLSSRRRSLERLALGVPLAARDGWCRRFEGLYRERIGASLHAALGYRQDLFAYLRGLATEHGMTYALCMEYRQPVTAGSLPQGLNRDYTTCRNCEGLDVPLYVRESRDEPFRPLSGCDGACLFCPPEVAAAVCGVPELAGGGGWSLADYRRFGRVRAAGGGRADPGR